MVALRTDPTGPAVPADWRSTRLSSVLRFQVGFPFSSAFFNEDGGGVRLIRNRDLKSDDQVLYYSGRFHSSYIVHDGDLLVGMDGDFVLCLWRKGNSLLNQRVGRIVCLSGLNPTYAYYALQGPLTAIQVATAATTVKHLSHDDVESIEMALPRIEEQSSIAKALSDADAYVESLEKLIAKKRDLKQGAMQELLTGKRRVPGFSSAWIMRRLVDIADIRSGGTPSTHQSPFWDGGILWCTPTDITSLRGKKYLEGTTRTISMLGLKSSSAEMIPPNSVVMTTRATIGECAINRVPVTTNQGFKNFTPLPDVDVEFLYYLLLTQKQNFIGLCGGSTFLEIGKSQLLAFSVLMPPSRDEQVAISSILSDMDSDIGALETKIDKVRNIKQGMLQNLLTGRIRLV